MQTPHPVGLKLLRVRLTTCKRLCRRVHGPVVLVRIPWIMETLASPANTVGRVSRFCRRWLSPGRATRISHGRNRNGTAEDKRVVNRVQRVVNRVQRVVNRVQRVVNRVQRVVKQSAEEKQ